MTAIAASSRPSGQVSLRVIRGGPDLGDRRPAHILNILRYAFPRPGLPAAVNAWRLTNLPGLLRALLRIWTGALFGVPVLYGAVFCRKITASGQVLELGLGSLRVVTTAGVTFIAAKMGNTTPANIANLKYHGFGVGTTAENIADTTLVTELTTEYATDNVRPTGSQSPAAGVYTTVGTLSPDGAGTLAITEHGIFDQAAVGGGTLLDRSVFAAVNLTRSADSLQVTYAFTLTAGG